MAPDGELWEPFKVEELGEHIKKLLGNLRKRREALSDLHLGGAFQKYRWAYRQNLDA